MCISCVYLHTLYITTNEQQPIHHLSATSPQNELPPKDLTFSIIRIPNDGQKLSPPSLELDDGLYILLRSQSKTKLATIPSNLRSLTLLTDGDLSEIPHCPWSLSGPQYPRRAGERVQQRYWYPRGVGEYSNGKGGSMWTVVNKKGQEDIGCRLLHVYHSSKRADNAKPKAKRGRGRPRKENNNTTSTSTTTIHAAVGTRKSKRKKSQAISTFHQDDEESDRKKMKITTTTSSLEQSSNLMQGDLLQSPNNSFDRPNAEVAPQNDNNDHDSHDSSITNGSTMKNAPSGLDGEQVDPLSPSLVTRLLHGIYICIVMPFKLARFILITIWKFIFNKKTLLLVFHLCGWLFLSRVSQYKASVIQR